jgi:GntR family transcriptional regulator, transcriptional repressor for pyruvate dehydrogenase complex
VEAVTEVESVGVWGAIDLSVGSIPDRISERISGLIDRGEIPPGTRLPSERQLMTMLGASRISIRQALQDLELHGYLSRTPRVGRVVAPPSMRTIDGSIFGGMARDQRTIREVMDMRAVIEPPIAQRAASRRRAAELDLLCEPLEASERELTHRAPRPDTMYACDVRFHQTIAKLSHNAMLEKLVEVTHEWMAPSRHVVFQTEQRIRLSVTAHRTIFQAIADGAPQRAHAAMHDHLQDVLKTIEPLVV